MFRRTGRRCFRDFELLILDAVSSHLSHDARTILDQQLDRVVKVQRILGAVEVNAYFVRRRGAPIPDMPLFPTDQVEVKFATIKLSVLPSELTVGCTLWIVKRHYFSMEFSAPTKGCLAERTRLLAVDILNDPCN